MEHNKRRCKCPDCVPKAFKPLPELPKLAEGYKYVEAWYNKQGWWIRIRTPRMDITQRLSEILIKHD